MNIDKFKHQHHSILGSIDQLRHLTHSGIEANADDIAATIVKMSSIIKLHLAVEDRALYPALEQSDNTNMARMGRQYQDEMGAISQLYDGFSRRWNHPASLRENGESFRTEANHVLRKVHERILRENREFYPLIEAM